MLFAINELQRTDKHVSSEVVMGGGGTIITTQRGEIGLRKKVYRTARSPLLVEMVCRAQMESPKGGKK